MNFLKSYQTEIGVGQWGSTGITVSCEFHFDDLHESNLFVEALQYDMDTTLKKMVKRPPKYHILTCPNCFTTTKVYSSAEVLQIGEGDHVLGCCSKCEYAFRAELR